ncbi:MAG TPA: hypothetical protein VHE81_14550 [Lacipirellulaceae bacterium]|nr:hypothetical protein [Lacipirellulaceae bacterium]
MIPRFRLGLYTITPEAARVIEESGQESTYFLIRHMRGDWGSISAEETARNDAAITSGGELRSVYKTLLGKTIWIVTSADRRKTTVMLAG